MTLKGEKKLAGGLKNNIRNLVNFHVSSRMSENLHFDGIFLSKAYNVLDEKAPLCQMTLKSDSKKS